MRRRHLSLPWFALFHVLMQVWQRPKQPPTWTCVLQGQACRHHARLRKSVQILFSGGGRRQQCRRALLHGHHAASRAGHQGRFRALGRLLPTRGAGRPRACAVPTCYLVLPPPPLHCISAPLFTPRFRYSEGIGVQADDEKALALFQVRLHAALLRGCVQNARVGVLQSALFTLLALTPCIGCRAGSSGARA